MDVDLMQTSMLSPFLFVDVQLTEYHNILLFMWIYSFSMKTETDQKSFSQENPELNLKRLIRGTNAIVRIS
jgi:hypothetical protein